MPKKKAKLAKKKKKAELQTQHEPHDKRNLKDLAKDVVASYDTRIKVVGEIIDDTHKMMADFRERRENMSKDLRESLAKHESLRKKDFDRMMADITAQQNRREEEVKKMLEDFRREEEVTAERLRNLLSKREGIRIRDFKKMMADIRQDQEARTKETASSITDELEKMRGEVCAMLDNFKKERYSVANAWHEILGLFRSGRSTIGLTSNPGSNPSVDNQSSQESELTEA